MKLSVSYNFFNGEEHLIPSILSVRNSVDFITIVYQNFSNAGNAISAEALDVLNDIRKNKLVEKIIEFKPDSSLARHRNELAKRSIGLQEALNAKCTHFFTMDADEFYRRKELDFAKDYIFRNRINASSVDSYFHIKTPNWRAKDTTRCAFITKINDRTQIGSGDYYIAMVDSTRSLKPVKSNSIISIALGRFFPTIVHIHFEDTDVAMYHMNFVRKDEMNSKLANTSTTDIAFLEKIRARYLEWQPGTIFSFPNKGDFKFDHVRNEFATWTPE